MSKYCLYRDRPIGLTATAQATGSIDGLGCNIFGVWHECAKCPNCTEMGDNVSYEASSSCGNDMWPNYIKD